MRGRLTSLLGALERRARDDERGMTLIELLVAIGGALAVLFAAYAAMQVAMTGQIRIEDRIDVTARGRLGMERITRDIRSQQCLPGATEGEQLPAMVIATDYFLEFYTSVAPAKNSSSNTPQQIERRRLEWVPVSAASRGFPADGGPTVVGDIVETVWRSASTTPPYAFPSTATAKNVLATDVQLQAGQTNIFNYYSYATGDLGRPSTTPEPLIVPATATTLNPSKRPQVDPDDLAGIVMADVRFAVRPRHSKVGQSRTINFSNRVSVRTADPYDPTRRPFCL